MQVDSFTYFSTYAYYMHIMHFSVDAFDAFVIPESLPGCYCCGVLGVFCRYGVVLNQMGAEPSLLRWLRCSVDFETLDRWSGSRTPIKDWSH